MMKAVGVIFEKADGGGDGGAGGVGAGGGQFATFEMCLQRGVVDKADGGDDGGAGGVGYLLL